ncbi:MAG: glycoside hydrolase family 65 [Bryobacteraceae bacterium]
MRENPHRLHLGRIGLALLAPSGLPARPEDLKDVRQELDLWTGKLSSSFVFEGKPVAVETCCHPDRGMLAVRIRSSLIGQGRLSVAFEFPYGSPAMDAAGWNRPEAHQSRGRPHPPRRFDIERQLDADSYWVSIGWQGQAELRQQGPHRFVLSASAGDELDLVCLFSPRPDSSSLPSAREVFERCATHWNRFWSEGGAIELEGSRDPRARELERRIVLSQYLTAIQCAGSLPPQETGLTLNSWYGKFHLEMHWWHAAHFPLWGRAALLERSMDWYRRILPKAQRKAREQGYTGARWPKMVGPEGRDSPSPVGPLLIWQQPHPIVFAELCYRARPGRETLERYREMVFASAEFMASFAVRQPRTGRYVLGPPVIPAQENHPPRETWNPTFELEYWAHGLELAQLWRRRLGLPPHPAWEQVRKILADLPVRDGLYMAHENCPQTFTERNRDHPSMLAALGMLPGRKVDREIMRRTLHKVLQVWRWEDTWGWDYPMMAMTAARLGEPETAVRALLMQTPRTTGRRTGTSGSAPTCPVPARQRRPAGGNGHDGGGMAGRSPHPRPRFSPA